MWPLPISKKQLNKLGKRLSLHSTPEREDLLSLNQVLLAYQAILDDVKGSLDDIGLPATTRVKTTSTLIEKLRRESSMSLSRVQDIAGARIIVNGGRLEQDQVVKRIIDFFAPEHDVLPRAIDRRTTPSSGYRAVHVVIHPSGVPVEIQVRTELQNAWAQLFEGLADRWGRAIRYGGNPDQPRRVVMRLSRRRSLTRQSLMGMLTFASEEIDRIERLETYIESIRSFVSEVDSGTHKHWSLDDSGQLKPITGDDATDAMIHYRRIRRAFMETMESLLPDRRARGRLIRRHVPRNHSPTPQFVLERIHGCNLAVADLERARDEEFRHRTGATRLILDTLQRRLELGGPT